MPWSRNWQDGGTAPSELESTGGFPIVIPQETPPREQSRLVIICVAFVLMLGLIWAAFSLRDFGSKNDLIPSDVVTPLPSAAGSAPAGSQSGATTQSTPTPTNGPTTAQPGNGAPVRVDSVRAIDPQGDGDEDSAAAKNVIDEKSGTTWRSQTYKSSAFGGLKDGVGLVFKLKTPALVKSADIRFKGSGGSVQLRTADEPDLSGSKVVGRAALDGGRATVGAGSASASRYVILWFTKLPSAEGKYRIEISEVRLT
jgi:hypothetical protein